MNRGFEGTALDHYEAGRLDLQSRWDGVGDWWNGRLTAGVDPFQRITMSRINPLVTGSYRDGKPFSGLNFASQEYLSLASHPEIRGGCRQRGEALRRS